MQIKFLLRSIGKAVLPYGIFVFLKRQRDIKISYGNSRKNYCPICQKEGYFLPSGTPPRTKSRYQSCGSVERHRLLWLFFQKYTNILSKPQQSILHVAAESCIKNRIGKLHGKNYVTADLKNQNAMVKMDIMEIQYSDEAFDIIICNHVLEHVIDDIKAMKEIYRVLKKGGWAILLVPIANIEKTYEDETITSDGGRFWAFGQGNHIRKYGKDYEERLKSVGFNVKIIGSDELAGDDGIEKMRLKENVEAWGFMETKIYYCKK
jgi:predicted SAM-dependent methyltransferase